MTVPDLDGMLPRTVVLQPAWSDTVASVLPQYRDSTVSDPIHRIRVPAGVSIITVVEDTRFAAIAKYMRGDLEREILTFDQEATFQIVSEVDTEMWFEWAGGTPNTSDRANTRMGVTIYSAGLN